MLIVVLALISAPWVNIPADNADSAGMQAHLHAIFVDRDLLYDDEYAALGTSPLFAFVTERGVVSNHWPIGASFVQAPGWLLGRVAGHALVGDGISTRAATWTLPLLGLRCWALLVLAWLSVAVHRWLRPRTDTKTALLASAALVLGTPLLYYAAESPLRPHLWGAAIVALATMRWLDAIERAAEDPERARASLRRPLELATYVGLATAIRPQLAVLVVLVAHERWLASAELNLGARARLLLGHGLACAALASVWPLLVLRMQLWMYGGLGDYGGEVSHHLRAFLLSTHHGALVWCPVLVVGGLGLAIGAAQRERGAIVLLVLLALQIWLDAGTREIEPYRVLGTRTWTGGTAFGPRKLLDAVPLMLPGVVWLHRWLGSQPAREGRRWRTRLAVATGLALLPTLLLFAGALIDPKLCSTVIDGERFSVALGLGFDLDGWQQAWAQRELPLRVTLWSAAVVALPLSSVVIVALALTRGRSRSRRRFAWIVVLGAGVVANGWLSHLEARSSAALAADPQRMESAAARMNPWHELTVSEIPRHQAILRARLGDGV